MIITVGWCKLDLIMSQINSNLDLLTYGKIHATLKKSDPEGQLFMGKSKSRYPSITLPRGKFKVCYLKAKLSMAYLLP